MTVTRSPTFVGALCVRAMYPPTVVSSGGKNGVMAFTAASSMRAESTGVANTSSVPLLTVFAVSFVVTE